MFVQVMARFERGQAAFSCVGGKGQNPEINGERCARRLLRFLDQEEGSVDPFLCDQIIVPLLLARTGGQVTTSHLTAQVSVVAAVAAKFGLGVRIWGETGTAGGLAVEAG